MSRQMDYTNIPKEKFEFYQRDESIHDKKFDTKPVGYFQDAMIRFSRNKSSVAAAIIILFLLLFTFFVPVLFSNNYTRSTMDTTYLQYSKLLPKSKIFSFLGWDGTSKETLSKSDYLARNAIMEETGMNPIVSVYREDYVDATNTSNTTYYDVRTDSYLKNGMIYMTITPSEYEAIQQWQLDNQIQVIYPAVDTSDFKVDSLKNNANIWYECTNKGTPKLNANNEYVSLYRTAGNDGNYDSLRIEGDDGSYRYAVATGTSTAISYKVRIFTYTYFQYRYGFEPEFLFGTNAYGQDIITRLAGGARFSLVLAICVSVINLIIGAVYGAIEGYYGGAIDLIMERISDILGGVPFIVVTSLFQLHLSRKVGVVPALLFAFVLTGWIGMASQVRMQFYRYKNQEYVLAARTLGAKDSRLMFRHIFPNALGTLITGCALTIPSVVYSESNLTYLGIVNLDSASMSSIGSMLSAGQPLLANYPHIILFPAIFISLMMISFNLFGNGLRDAFNPSLRGTED
ncbi:MAG TPA: ABC transporter permease [Lachnospiraceae bacterium]|nr:ABC transporter permease [Lachnospiraceae bacterium]